MFSIPMIIDNNIPRGLFNYLLLAYNYNNYSYYYWLLARNVCVYIYYTCLKQLLLSNISPNMTVYHSLDIGLYLYRVLKNQRLISSYMYMYMHVHVHVYVHTYTNMQLLYINVHTYSKWYVHVCTCTCMLIMI